MLIKRAKFAQENTVRLPVWLPSFAYAISPNDEKDLKPLDVQLERG